jgi:site-specific recombinase XerC
MAGITDPVFFKLVRDFLKVYLPLQKNCSPHTIRAYQTGLEQFFDFTKKRRGSAWLICLFASWTRTWSAITWIGWKQRAGAALPQGTTG